MEKIQWQREKERNREGESAKNNRRDGPEFDGKIMKKSSKKWSRRVSRDPKFIEKAVREATGAPRGLPSKKRVCGLSLFSTSEAPGGRFLDPGRDPKMTQNRAVEPKWPPRQGFFIDFGRFKRFSQFSARFCIDFA